MMRIFYSCTTMKEINIVNQLLKLAFGAIGAIALIGSIQKPHAIYVAVIAILICVLIPWKENDKGNRKRRSY